MNSNEIKEVKYLELTPMEVATSMFEYAVSYKAMYKILRKIVIGTISHALVTKEYNNINSKDWYNQTVIFLNLNTVVGNDLSVNEDHFLLKLFVEVNGLYRSVFFYTPSDFKLHDTEDDTRFGWIVKEGKWVYRTA